MSPRYTAKMLLLLPTLLACRPADLTVANVTDLGPLPTTTSVKGRDGGYSAGFDGRTVWLYGDTILSLAGEDGSSWRDNSWSSSLDLDGSDGLDGFEEPVDALGAPVEFFPETEDERVYNEAHRDVDLDGDGASDCEAPCGGREVLWPKAMVTGPDGDALIFYVKIHGEPGAWNFYNRGTGIATWASFDAAVERPEPGVVADDPTLLWGADEIGPGDAALVHDGAVYAYACDDPDGWGKPCSVSRAAFSDALDRDAWEYWSGDEWTSDPTDARTLFEGSPQLSVSWNPALERFVAVYDALGTVEFRTALAPEGPWSAPVEAFDTEPPPDADGFTYCGMAHAELQEQNGFVQYVSYYRGTGDWTGEIRLVRVELEAR